MCSADCQQLVQLNHGLLSIGELDWVVNDAVPALSQEATYCMTLVNEQ